MKNIVFSLLTATALSTLSATGQVTHSTEITEIAPAQSTTVVETAPVAPASSTTVIETAPPVAPSTSATVIETAPPVSSATVVHQLDPVVAQQHLSVAPQTVTVTPEQRIALDRTVTIESRPVQRVYNVERNVVIVEEQGTSRALPYVAVPVLFVVDTAELLDAESRIALEQTAAVINAIVQTEPNALFDIEGHTSTEGTDEHNLRLSADRARRVLAELTQRYGVPETALTAHGYGENYPAIQEATEADRQQNRRVLVVRTR